ncbi:hypothetical protein CANMA_004422 [Candida margitis]|uniref:uncharacterized protein n=1 Tax=Candida margitis TaxID=1775924 RepID=UPI002226EAA2|nr:uncharacterized protein CANMA_004422 [Candida margitis]KAI5957418.1 hypothetical protein CANMA_004422 [Candida margitis]
MDEDVDSITENTSFKVDQKKILSLDYHRSILGVTCLDVENRKLYVYEDIEVSYPNTYIEAIIDDLEPDVVFASSRCTETMITFLRALEAERNLALFVKIVSDYTKFDHQILAQSFDKYIGTVSSKLFIDAALKSPYFKLSVKYLGLAEMVDTIDACSFKNLMFMDVDSLFALQVVPDPQVKPSISKDSKTSLLDFVNHTATREGYLLLRDWVRKPLANLQLIKDRQAAVRALSFESFKESRKQVFRFLSQLKSSFRKIKRLRANELLWNSWKSLLVFLSNSVQIVKLLKLHFTTINAEPAPLFKFAILLKDDVFEFQKLSDTILSIIEIQSSAEEGKVRVLSGVDEEIDRLRIIYNDLESILQDCTQTLKFTYNQSFNTVYIPQLGFLVSTEIADLSHEANFPNEWEKVFITPTNAYYKCNEVQDLDANYGDVHTLINDREIEIIQGLQEEVLNYEQKILDIIDGLVELDCLCSLAEVSVLPGYNFPTLTDGLDLQINSGRHVLLESCSNMVVPNDVHYEGSERVIIITGANFSGKSIFLKQTALIVVLAQIGCAVPVESAVIGVILAGNSMPEKIWSTR